MPPRRWFSYTRKQRRIILGCGVCLGMLTLLLLGLAIGAVLRSTHSLRGAGEGAGGTAGANSAGGALSPEDVCAWDSWRLPRSVVPRAYNLSFNVQMSEPFMVQGTAAIAVDVLQVCGQ